MQCGKCRIELPDRSVFCPRCGNRVRGGTPRPSITMERPAAMTVLAVLQFLGFAFSGFAVFAGTMVGISGKGWDLGYLAVFVALAVLQLTAGIGLWKRRPYGRTIQLIMSWIGLLAIPLGTIISAVILYYLYRPHVKVLYSGKTERELTAQEVEALTAETGAGLGVAIAIGAVVFVCVVGIIAAIAVPNFLHALGRAKQKRTLADMESIAVSIKSYAIDHNRYPDAESLQDLEVELVPTYVPELPQTDGWGREFVIQSDAAGYMIQSAGGDGTFESDPPGGATSQVDADIILASGSFVQWPDGLVQ